MVPAIQEGIHESVAQSMHHNYGRIIAETIQNSYVGANLTLPIISTILQFSLPLHPSLPKGECVYNEMYACAEGEPGNKARRGL